MILYDNTTSSVNNKTIIQNRYDQSCLDMLVKIHDVYTSKDNFSDGNRDAYYIDGTKRII